MAVEFYTMYGGFLFLGIFLGLLFLLATVLIIYYKQVSEGYEDQRRYQIMQQVGMSPGEVALSTGTLNIPGRMGCTKADIYTASPYTIAASLLNGKITDPRKVL